MRICIDGHNLSLAQGTGIRTYARNLVHGLQNTEEHQVDLLFGLPLSDTQDPWLASAQFRQTLSLGYTSDTKISALQHAKAALTQILSLRARTIALNEPLMVKDFHIASTTGVKNYPHLFRLARQFFNRSGRLLSIDVGESVDVMHWTYVAPLHARNVSNIYTIHDIIPLTHPETTNFDLAQYKRLVETCVSRADLLCTVSESSKEAIEEYFPGARGKLVNTGQPVRISRPANLNVLKFFDLQPQGYLLAVGAIEPKKNIPRLVQAYLDSGVDLPLVIVGPKAWMSDTELNLVTSLHAQSCLARKAIRYLGYQSRDVVDSLIDGASLLCMLSLVEGYGLPMMEAVALGTPVLASDIPVFREIAGNAIDFVDAKNTEAIASKLKTICQPFADRSDTQVRGSSHLMMADDKNFNQAMGEVYEKAARSAPHNN